MYKNRHTQRLMLHLWPLLWLYDKKNGCRLAMSPPTSMLLVHQAHLVGEPISDHREPSTCEKYLMSGMLYTDRRKKRREERTSSKDTEERVCPVV